MFTCILFRYYNIDGEFMIENDPAYKVALKTKGYGTHRWISIRALTLIDDKWAKLFLKFSDDLVRGAKIPDKQFHDFRNHVFHPPNWGGAPKAAEFYYTKMVEALKKKDWRSAVLYAGITSHYLADVHHPMHTGQTKEEKIVHKIHEFGSAKHFKEYDKLMHLKVFDVPSIQQAVKNGAFDSFDYYTESIVEFDLAAATREGPLAGIVPRLVEINSHLLEGAISLTGSVWRKAIQEAGVKPPRVLSLLVALRDVILSPIKMGKKAKEEKEHGKIVKAMTHEFKSTGDVNKSLTPDEKGQIKYFDELDKKGRLKKPKLRRKRRSRRTRKSKRKTEKSPKHVETAKPITKTQTVVEKETMPIAQTTTTKMTKKTKKEKAPREKKVKEKRKRGPYLFAEDPIDDAPEIGKTTAKRLNQVGIITVQDLLDANPEELAKKLSHRRIKADDIARWQKECKLMMSVRVLRGHDAQILFGIGLDTKEKLANADPDEVLKKALDFVATKKGKRAMRGGKIPDKKEVTDWINAAKE